MNIIVAVLGCKSSLYTLLIEEGIKKTWGSCKHPNVKIIYYYGQQINEPYITTNDEVILNVYESLDNVTLKTLLFYEYLNNQNFDYVFRTNCSSYVNIDKLLKFLEDKPKESFFSSIIGTLDNKQFASGSGYFLSKDLVKKIVDNKHLFNTRIIDDLSISYTLADLGVSITPGCRQDFFSVEQVIREIDVTNYHFRCKSRYRDLNDTYIDIEIMKTIHKYLH